jgi:hypothetical protein
MPTLAAFVQRLLTEGKALLRKPPSFRAAERAEAARVLEPAFGAYRLSMAGPALDFDASAAVDAAEHVAWACWFLLHRDEEAAAVEKALDFPAPPDPTPAACLSADLTLRYLPQVYRRARGLDPSDVLTAALARTLRRWPLSGVLSDEEEGPLTPVAFGGHAGLLLLYAERLAEHYRPAWSPSGAAREYVELVFAERGLAAPAAKPEDV